MRFEQDRGRRSQNCSALQANTPCAIRQIACSFRPTSGLFRQTKKPVKTWYLSQYFLQNCICMQWIFEFLLHYFILLVTITANDLIFEFSTYIFFIQPTAQIQERKTILPLVQYFLTEYTILNLNLVLLFHNYANCRSYK